MKLVSKKPKIVIASSLSLVVALVGVTPLFAQSPLQTNERPAASCARITTLATSGKTAVSEKRTNLQTNFAERLTNVSTKQTGIDQKISDARITAKTRFDEKIQSLQAREDLTQVQSDALDIYVEKVQEAEVTRKAAVDTARSTYRTALANAVATQQQGLSTAATTYQTAVNTAFATAQANCTDANAAATLATLKEDLQEARETFSAARKPEASKEAIKALATTRDEAIKTANATFAKSVATYTETLKKAFEIIVVGDDATPKPTVE